MSLRRFAYLLRQKKKKKTPLLCRFCGVRTSDFLSLFQFNTQMTSSFSQRNLTPPPSPRHGNTPSFTEEMKMEDLILEHYDCIGEGLINTMELFRKDKGDMLHFETTMLFSGLKVGMMSGDFSMEDKRDISRTWSGEG
mmetsp:Transcript_11532/g.24469  ORF Transcript_11532/g.24469 Transcript_11532/m.24469 type:complete len:138 (+) Transcript_11532:435-848(+)